mmetsp:Transcript_99150/g.180931  ORF Transcript_99150/g.180931 Transcript_99150/m.180931 type:complete len:1045 (+) Transcript_99150:5-3139(+)
MPRCTKCLKAGCRSLAKVNVPAVYGAAVTPQQRVAPTAQNSSADSGSSTISLGVASHRIYTKSRVVQAKPPLNLEALNSSVNSRASVGTGVLEDVATFCSEAFESQSPERCKEAVALFSAAFGKAALGAIRSASAARGCGLLLSLFLHPHEECRRVALVTAARDLDTAQLLRAAAQGLGGRDSARKWQAIVNAVHAVRLCASKTEVLDSLRFGGLGSLLEVWKMGAHLADVANECCLLALLLTPAHTRTVANSGVIDCALATWQRFSRDVARGPLLQATVELTLVCLPHLPEKPSTLPCLAADSLRAQQPVCAPSLVNVLLRALARLGEDPKLATELTSLGVPGLAMAALTNERCAQEVSVRRLAAQAFARPLLSLSEVGRASVVRSSQSVGSAGHAFHGDTSVNTIVTRPAALPSAAVVATAAVGQALEPTLSQLSCAAALHRHLEAWRARVGGGAGHSCIAATVAAATASVAARVAAEAAAVSPAPSPAVASTVGDDSMSALSAPAPSATPAPLQLDGDFESGSLGSVVRFGPREYEVRLLPDMTNGSTGSHVQWFCFRIRGMSAEEPYVFHLTNLAKPASLFDEGCRPVFFSRRRHEESRTGWTRAGSDIAYYPCSDGARRHCISLEVTFPYDEDEAFLAHAVPYTVSDLQADLARWQPETPRRSLVQSCGGQDITALSYGDPDAAYGVCVIARAHPGETHASWVMRGFMDFLLGGSPESQACLRELRWLVVPMLNPDGVAAGRTRTNLEGVDLNRHHHDNNAPETRGLRVALQEEVRAGPIPLAFVDIHSHSRRRGIFFITNGHEADPLVACMAARTELLDGPGTSRPELRASDEGVGRVAASRIGYRHSVTLESSLAARHAAAGGQHLSIQDLLDAGRALCLALYDLSKGGGVPVACRTAGGGIACSAVADDAANATVAATLPRDAAVDVAPADSAAPTGKIERVLSAPEPKVSANRETGEVADDVSEGGLEASHAEVIAMEPTALATAATNSSAKEALQGIGLEAVVSREAAPAGRSLVLADDTCHRPDVLTSEACNR